MPLRKYEDFLNLSTKDLTNAIKKIKWPFRLRDRVSYHIETS